MFCPRRACPSWMTPVNSGPSDLPPMHSGHLESLLLAAIFLNRFWVRKTSEFGVDKEGFPNLTPPGPRAEGRPPNSHG